MFELVVLAIGIVLLVSNTIILSIVAEERNSKVEETKIFIKD